MTTPVPVPEFRGFAICRYTSFLGIPEDKIPVERKAYQTSPLTLEYDAKNWIYRFFLKVRYTGQWPPYVFAIIYPGETREEETRLMPLVNPGFGPADGLHPVLPSDFNESAHMKKFMFPLQKSDPASKLPIYYGFSQFDYHYSEICYQPGLHTIEVKLGTAGFTPATVDQWAGPVRCQWNISQYTPPKT